ncbi:hypothetical protein BF49_2695 [Bradyrhizobium sp.]|nr:hypothetical protein BF49_2695 [Bradyrhizobium sp.]
MRHDDVCVLSSVWLRCAELRNRRERAKNGTSPPPRTSKGRRGMAGVKQAGEAPTRECPGHRRAEATPSFGRLSPGHHELRDRSVGSGSRGAQRTRSSRLA